MLDIAPMIPSFFVETNPSRKPLAQKSLLAPYRTCRIVGSITSRRSSASVERNEIGVAIAAFTNTDFA